MSDSTSNDKKTAHRRRPRYRGKNPRRFEEKYKEREPERYTDTVAKVLASGGTPAGSHRPIMVAEILQVLAPEPGELAVDCTLGYGGHAEAILPRLLPGGHLIGIDSDPLELPKTEARLRAAGFAAENFTTARSNFAGLPKVLGARRADVILADLGVSSMQLDDPARGFSLKHDGPVDMRMNPNRGEPVSALLAKIDRQTLAQLLFDNADEPHASRVAESIAGGQFSGTLALASSIRRVLTALKEDERELSVRRVFQALRIAVNDEFAALETLLRVVPLSLHAGGRAAILSFHSGEDRRVKKAFAAGLRDGVYSAIADDVLRPTPAERYANPRATSAKLRWARLATN